LLLIVVNCCWLLFGPIEIEWFPHSIWWPSQCPRIGSSMLYHCRLHVNQTSLMIKIASNWACRYYRHSAMLLRKRLGIQLYNRSVPGKLFNLLPHSPPDVLRSIFILLTPSRFRILYLYRMPEFLFQGYSTWCWTTLNITKFHSFISHVFVLKSWSPRMDKQSYGERL
jgi:hypothetical protein